MKGMKIKGVIGEVFLIIALIEFGGLALLSEKKMLLGWGIITIIGINFCAFVIYIVGLEIILIKGKIDAFLGA